MRWSSVWGRWRTKTFVEGTNYDHGNMPLHEDVKQLPSCVLKRLLAGEALQLQLENEAYALLVAWLLQSPHADDISDDGDDVVDRHIPCSRTWPRCMRYHHMTTDLLANVVCLCPLMNESGLALSVVLSAIVQRDVLPSIQKKIDTGKSDRGMGASRASWEVKATFTLEEVAALGPDVDIRRWCGLVAGYEAYVQVKRETEEGDTLGVHLGISLPTAAVESADWLDAGVRLKYNVTLSPDEEAGWESDFLHHQSSQWPNVFDKPWAEAVREGSPHFPGGKLEVTASLKLATKK